MAKEKEKEKKKTPKTDLEKSLEGLDEVGRGDFFTPKEGPNKIRIVPWREMFFFKAELHYGMKRPGGGKETAYPCLLSFGEKSCPVCDFHEELAKSENEGKLKLAGRVRVKTKFYVNVLDRARANEGIKIYGFSPKMMRTLRGYLEDEDYGDITDVEDGKDIVLTREGTGFTSTSYEIRVRAKSTPLEYENWEEELHDLSAIAEKVSSEFLKKRVAELRGGIKKGKKDEEEEEDDDLEEGDDKEKDDEKEDDLEDDDDKNKHKKKK